MSDILYPLRRDLEYIPIQHDEQQLVLVRDQLDLTPHGQAIPLASFQLLARVPTGSTVEDLRKLIAWHSGGSDITLQQVKELIQELDKVYLLESPRYMEAKDAALKAYASEEVRQSALAGGAYPKEPEALSGFLDTLLQYPAPDAQPGGQESHTPVKALVAPHIDPNVGGRVYAAAYNTLRGASPQRVIILGVGHQLMAGLFCPTSKDFQTPLGLAKNDTSLTKTLLQSGSQALASADFPHRFEHSIEFQLLFLQHLLKGAFSIAPILCGSLLHGLPEYNRQAFLDAAGPLLETLATALADPVLETICVAGVDFCHIGPKFGHEVHADVLETEACRHDRTLLDAVCAGDAEAFWKESAAVEDRYNVCGFSALATLLEILPRTGGAPRGRELGYEIWREEPTSSAVSYAAAVFG